MENFLNKSVPQKNLMLEEIAVKIKKLTQRFTKIEKLGHGSYGTVTKCKDEERNIIVALKQIKVLKENEEYRKKLYREISILMKLDHPNINKLYDVFFVEEEECYYLELEYCQHDLYNLIESNVLTLNQKKSIMNQILVGLKYLNDNGILHRDIKPANILIKDGLTVQIADFGLAKEVDSAPANIHIITLAFRPLELLLGENNYGSEVDIWSAAVVFYQLMTNDYLFSKPASEDVMIGNIIAVCGTPSKEEWPNMEELPYFNKIYSRRTTQSILYKKFNTKTRKDFGVIVDEVIKMLSINPSQRPTAEQLLESGAFDDYEVEPILTEEGHQSSSYKDSPVIKNYDRLMFNRSIIRPEMPIPLLTCY